ncbi:MAG: hypothetical protein IPM29_19740 [Planctomycetes bacterium]|nr:hypothetical protein [Planctomycetota bacterium]
MNRIRILVAALTLVGAAASQSSLTTTFANNNGRSTPGVTVYFDIQLNIGIAITAFDLNILAGTGLQGTVDVYLTGAGNTYVGNQTNAAAWTLAGSSNTFVGGAPGTPTNATFAQPVTIAPGSYGLAIAYNGVGASYTNGNGSNQVYSNADMTLSCGSATAALFSSTLFDPRVWNGTIYYTPGSNFARSIPYGTGCGTPALGLRGVARPVIGSTATAETTSIPAASTAGILLFGITSIEPGLDLTVIGMPGCFLNVGSEFSPGFAPVGATVLHQIPIPNVPALAGARLHMQSVVDSPGTNPLGFISSNGLRLILDVQ